MHYAFVGLGNLGRHLAGSLVKAGFTVTVSDLDKARAESLLAAGARWADDPKSAAAAADAAITCLPSPAASAAVAPQLFEALAPGATWIEMSTNDHREIARLAELAASKDIATLEAPVTGGVHRAASGEITVLAGGPEAIFEKHRPALEAMGGEVIHMGPLGSAALIKVITNMLAFIHLIADGEALMLAKKGGLDLGKAWKAIKASSGSSFVHETEGQLILNGSYDVGFTMDLACKDLGFAAGYGRALGVPLELAGLTEQTFVRARAQYGGQAQSTQVVKLLEDALGTDLRAPGFPEKLTE
ncbi:3-hydroxyisobutyrate dehydrogenase [Tistlia consotensis]|uniref:3-hydroxyisobutyrate dehydrogenase n=1 Tax=Tistlia consotensis USBA 355 TaxID=560819 RepID=A0A1Y6CTJ0_9PROT|nr:NAD(P)-dependent oxidoreductase [Tistlia consotensis]SMF76977.1 3-hydroxyisobutyrate dehydrogenase [Tistlia consotensis USBA 355]SNS13662.1 3-hydroxyisobutyrate dehydrogenase [Tistlia consotensis]